MERNEIFYGNSKEKYETPNLQIISALGTQGVLTTSPTVSDGFLGEWDEEGF